MQVAIIGAGPRGLAVAERLINLAEDDTKLDIQIFDPYAIGGRVWDPFISQNQQFLMNTVIDQITLFNDDSIENGGKPLPGPNLRQWLAGQAATFLAAHPEFDSFYQQEVARLKQPGDFASRGMMGVYAAWFFEWLTQRVRQNQTLTFTQQAVTQVTPIGQKFQLTLADGMQILSDQVVMALGHSDDYLSEEEAGFKTFAAENQLKYVAPMHPAEADLSAFDENDTIIVRGLGLSFFDYLSALTVGKGGQFVRNAAGELDYIPSGHEPHVIAGSRGGFPLHARGVNEKDTSELYVPKFFTLPALDALRAAGGGHLQYDDFEKLVVKELTYKYILNQLAIMPNRLPYDQAEALRQALLTSDDLTATAKAFGLDDIPVFDIDLIRNPARDLDAAVDYATWFKTYLRADIADAKLGNKHAPFAGTFDIMRDIRDRIRYVIEHEYFDADEYEKFLRQFKPFDVSVSVGPPLERIEQLLALIEAGIFEVTAPQIHVDTEGQQFVARDVRQQEFRGNALIEARLGATDIAISRNPVIENLRQQGLLVQPTRTRADGSTYQIGAATFDRQTFEVIDQNGNKVPHLYIYGITLEGLKWFGTVIPRPGVNTVILREAAWIAQRILAYA
ncbi:FAD/NAD(P)-binding protein [Leuconostoc lactis]|uniref:FAD/NAD(P)-binding protein n=1 Tax=Leuconostoc lactis TaxID=1246 RepID=UPI0006DC03C6|nr:FAD/NAD(P)-binding domain-containing protein [Leuconostoc lactis]KQB80549.1 FAD-dependent oxidoreductase [Leuconostoc lactis]QEA47231.1 FAD-dependent oxidoreductase [Leuconostoc lactis]HBP98063.1 FAD-dependent oxidoreductase [Leuconostoc lactis]